MFPRPRPGLGGHGGANTPTEQRVEKAASAPPLLALPQMPFRQARRGLWETCSWPETKGSPLNQLSLQELQTIPGASPFLSSPNLGGKPGPSETGLAEVLAHLPPSPQPPVLRREPRVGLRVGSTRPWGGTARSSVATGRSASCELSSGHSGPRALPTSPKSAPGPGGRVCFLPSLSASVVGSGGRWGSVERAVEVIREVGGRVTQAGLHPSSFPHHRPTPATPRH